MTLGGRHAHLYILAGNSGSSVWLLPLCKSKATGISRELSRDSTQVSPSWRHTLNTAWSSGSQIIRHVLLWIGKQRCLAEERGGSQVSPGWRHTLPYFTQHFFLLSTMFQHIAMSRAACKSLELWIPNISIVGMEWCRDVVCSVEKSGPIYLLSIAGMLFCAGRAILLCFAAMRFTTLSTTHVCLLSTVHCPAILLYFSRLCIMY